MLPPRIFFQKISIWRDDSSCILNSSKPGPDGRLAPTGSGTVIGEPGGPQLLLVKDLLAVEEGPLRIRDGGGIGWRMTGKAEFLVDNLRRCYPLCDCSHISGNGRAVLASIASCREIGFIVSATIWGCPTLQSRRVPFTDRITINIRIKINVASIKSDWIFRNESSLVRVVPARAVTHEARVGVEFATRVDVACRCRAANDIAKGIISQVSGDAAASVRQRPCGAHKIGDKVKSSTGVNLTEFTIDPQTVEIVRYRIAAPIEITYNVSAVIDKFDCRAGTAAALNAAAQRIVRVSDTNAT